MLREIKGLDNQHPIDVCLQGQANLDIYVDFLVINDANSNQQALIGKSYIFVQNQGDVNVEQLINASLRFASLDRESIEIIDQINVSIPIEIYSFALQIYSELIQIT